MIVAVVTFAVLLWLASRKPQSEIFNMEELILRTSKKQIDDVIKSLSVKKDENAKTC